MPIDMSDDMNDQLDQAVDDSQNRMLVRLAIGAGAVMGTVLVSIGGWIFMEVLECRQFRLSGDRYTQQDSLRDRAEMIDRLAVMMRDLERLKTKVEAIEGMN